MRLLHRWIAVLVGMTALAQLILWYSPLPAIVPSHFDAQGQVDGEMSKTAYCLLMAGIQLLVLPGSYLLGRGLSRIPNGMINVPYREYWLAPQRREATLARMTDMLLACGWSTSLLMVGIFQLTAEVAVGQRDTISPMTELLTVGYLILLAVWVVLGMFKFCRRPAEPPVVPPTAD